MLFGALKKIKIFSPGPKSCWKRRNRWLNLKMPSFEAILKHSLEFCDSYPDVDYTLFKHIQLSPVLAEADFSYILLKQVFFFVFSFFKVFITVSIGTGD